MNVGARFKHKQTGQILEYLHESSERAGTKVRVEYVCKVVSPEEKAGEIVIISVYAVFGPFNSYEELESEDSARPRI